MKEKLITDINVSSSLHWKVLRTQFVYVIIRVLFMPSAIQNPRNWSSVETYNGKNGAFQNNKIWIFLCKWMNEFRLNCVYNYRYIMTTG